VKIPAIFKKNKIQLKDFTPVILAGDADSDVIEWAHRFFTVHLGLMADKKVITVEESKSLLDDWLNHRHHPDTIFFSPIVVDVSGIKL
ncbi:MAG: hypothetical protein ABIY50_05630, partial [Ignavibacteria bacterium]